MMRKLKGVFLLARSWLLTPSAPRGLRVGQTFWPKDWSLEDARELGVPVVKRYLNNPLLPPRPQTRDWNDVFFFIVAAVTFLVWVALIGMFVGGFLEDDSLMLFRDLGLLGPKH